MTSPARIAVFASGGGTNLQALLDSFNHRSSTVARVELVVGSRAGLGALSRAEAAGVATLVIGRDRADSEGHPSSMLQALEAHRIELIVLAGYLKLVPLEVVQRFSGRMLNIHPALLPAFGGPGMYGLRVHEAVLRSGATVTGATVHLVGERYDEGPILAQWPVPVLADDTPESLAARVLRVEHLLLPAAVEAVATGAGAGSLQGSIHFDLSEGVAPTAESVRRLLY